MVFCCSDVGGEQNNILNGGISSGINIQHCKGTLILLIHHASEWHNSGDENRVPRATTPRIYEFIWSIINERLSGGP